MKKIFLLLLSICATAQVSFAQLIWHSDMGSPYSGIVALKWNARYYTFEANNYGDYGDPEEIWNSLEQQLSSEGVSWIRINSVENPASGVFEICFEMDENNTELSRSIYLGDGADYFKIKQVSKNDHPQPILPQNRCFEICPGGSISIPILETTNGEYEIMRIDSDNTEEIAYTFDGNSGTYTFTSRPAAGTYYFLGIPNSEFTVKYFDAFKYTFESDQSSIIADADGGVYKIYLTHYGDGNRRKIITRLSDLAFFDEPFASFNAGESVYWNPNIEISYGFDAELASGYIQIVCPPNISASEIINNSHIKLIGNTTLTVNQSGGGTVKNIPVEYSLDDSTSQIKARINNTQPKVIYTLYRDGIVQSNTLGNGYTVNLSAPRDSGRYYVVAEYSYGIYSGEAVLNSVTLTGDGNVLLDFDRNWIFSQMHNDDNKSVCDITYYNGLGYAQQEIQLRATENGEKDLIRPIVYDHLWRESRRYLPYARANGFGKFDTDALTNQTEFYRSKFSISDTDPYAYTETEYDAASDRILATRKQGIEYRGANRAERYNYFGNGANIVRRLDIDSPTGALTVNGYYAANTISAVKTTDEDGAVTIVYTDKEGRTIAEERQSRQSDGSVESLVTYYVYDNCGRLSWVITPKGYDLLQENMQYDYTDEFAHLYCYIYRYDNRGRIIEKCMPNRHPEYAVYDAGDRLVMSQDGNMRLDNKWMIYHYDALGRITSQSIIADDPDNDPSLRHKEFIADFANSAPPVIYSGEATVVRQYFYDDYAQLANPQLDFADDELTMENDSSRIDMRVKGLLVYERLAEIDYDGIDGYCERAFYYDYKGREIQRVENYELGYVTRTSNRYDFIGNLLSKREKYTHGDITDISESVYKYDPRNRMIKETVKFANDTLSTMRYVYDDLGQLSIKVYGHGRQAILETSTYNMQGWLTEKSSDMFDMKLRYYDPLHTATQPSYSGNISEWQWEHKNTEYDGNTAFTYAFSYDDLSRLIATDINGRNGSELPEDSSEICTETNISYDKNSNIEGFDRRFASSTKSFAFNYEGNRRVDEEYSGKTYSYDNNGNIVKEALSGLDISFNFLNLPCKFSKLSMTRDRFGKPKTTMHNYYYRYLADGTKMSVTYNLGGGLLYLGSARFAYGDNGTTFESLPFSGGRIVKTSNGCQAQYHFTDHLGSTRVVAEQGNQWTDIERRDYTPFGKEWDMPFYPTSENNFTFSGKEKQTVGELGFLDFGARFYDSEGGIFLQQDPLAEKYYHIGQYNYCAGNPIKFVDPDGKDAILIVFPDYKITSGNIKSSRFGHAGVLLINNKGKIGKTKYYEYGRYDSENLGIVRNRKVPDIKLDENGEPTKESLNNVMSAISNISGQGGRIEGAYIKSDKFEDMNEYAESKMSNNNNPDREQYSLATNNCGTFATDVIKQDPEVKGKSPLTILQIPNIMVKSYQNKFQRVFYNPAIEMQDNKE